MTAFTFRWIQKSERLWGLRRKWTTKSRTLKILKTNPVQKNLTERGVKNNLEKVPAAVRTDISVVVYQDAQNGDASLTNEQANVTGENTNAVILNAVFEVSSAMNFDAADEAAEVYSGELSETGDGTVGSGSSEAVVTSGRTPGRYQTKFRLRKEPIKRRTARHQKQRIQNRDSEAHCISDRSHGATCTGKGYNSVCSAKTQSFLMNRSDGRRITKAIRACISVLMMK